MAKATLNTIQADSIEEMLAGGEAGQQNQPDAEGALNMKTPPSWLMGFHAKPVGKNAAGFKKLANKEAYHFFGVQDALADWGRLNKKHIHKIQNKCKELAQGDAKVELKLESNICFRAYRTEFIDAAESFAQQKVTGMPLATIAPHKPDLELRYCGDLISGKQIAFYFPPRAKDNEKYYNYVVMLEYVTVSEDLL